jgi:glycosyltransferase involved in cell wall biosynthesis
VADAAGAVKIAYVCGNEVHYSWHRSLLDLMSYDLAHDQRVMRGGFVAIRYGTDGLGSARNQAVQHFLADDDAEWLWWVDTDMGFAPDTVDRLFEAADPAERPIVGGLCFFNREEASDEMGGYRTNVVPTVYDWVSKDGQMGWSVRWGYPPDSIVRAAGTGSACILIHRSVFEKIEQASGRVWYDRVPNTTTGQLIGEDLSFCLRAGALDIPVHVHTGVPTTHFKPMWLSEDHYAQQMLLNSIREKLADDAQAVPESA